MSLFGSECKMMDGESSVKAHRFVCSRGDKERCTITPSRCDSHWVGIHGAWNLSGDLRYLESF